jgi:phenylalanyl-tRNA synthetase alpha subunit
MTTATETATELKEHLLKAIKAASSLQELEDVRVEALGKKGHITNLMNSMQ